jgi:serine protease Do
MADRFFCNDANAQNAPAKPSAVPPEALTLQEAFVRIADTVKPAVVNISTVYVEKGGQGPDYQFYFGSPFEDFFDEFFGEGQPRQRQQRNRQYQRRYEGTGSGVIIDPAGYVLTNEHVVRDAKEIKVTLFDDKEYDGKLIGKDVRTDIAVIKIKAGKKLAFAKLGDSDKIRVGEWAIAIGSPFGLEETVTSGIISAVRQSLPIEGHSYRNLIQTDASINRGNSGGPLCNIQGEVIGINTAIYAPTGVFSGIGFAIPINSAKEVLGDLIEKGRVVRGWLGIDIRPVDPAIARSFKLPDTQGALINDVIKDSPAAKAGLQRGDVIREFDGKKIESVGTLQNIVGQTDPNRKVTLQIIRNGKAMTVQMSTGEMPSEAEVPEQQPSETPQNGGSSRQKQETAEWEGMQVMTLTDDIASQFNLPKNEKGVVVVDLQQATLADDIGLQPGDVIRAINTSPTPTVKDFQTVTKKVKVESGVVLDVDRQGRMIYLSYPGKENK